MGQPAYAAVAVALIFIALIGSVVGYKLYRRWQWRKVRRQQEAAEEAAAAEAINNRSTANLSSMHFPMRSTSPGPSMIGSLYGEAYPRESIGGRVSMSKASLYSVPAPAYYNGSSASEYALSRPRRSSSQGLLRVASPVASPAGYVSQEPSMPGSPISQSAVGAEGAVEAGGSPSSEPLDGPTHQRALSSASSTMTLRRQYAASTYRSGAYGGGVSPGPYRGAPSPGPYRSGPSPGPYHVRRDSYLPHLPENRDHVQIVPPTPLGFGLGGMAQAVDQKTLAFSTTSGIGDFNEDFSNGLLWVAQTPAEAEASRGANFSEEERKRYLAQGPSSSQTGAQSRSGLTPAMRGAIHNMLYNTASQPGSSGAQTPDASESRPRSPTHAAQWDGTGSSSDIGPSVSQRGGAAATPLSHPLEENGGDSIQNALRHDERSPLSGLINGQHDTSIADLSTNTMSDSPILQAFQHPSYTQRQAVAVAAANGGHTPQDSMNSTQGGLPGTPGLMSSSDSRSRTSSRTGPPSLAHAQQQQQQQLYQQQQQWDTEPAGVAHSPLKTNIEHSPPPQLNMPATEKRSSRGWFSMPSWRQSSGDASAA